MENKLAEIMAEFNTITGKEVEEVKVRKYSIEEVSYTKSLLEKASESMYYRPYLERCFNAIILASYDKEMATALYSDYLDICSNLEDLNEGIMPLIEGLERDNNEEADEIDW